MYILNPHSIFSHCMANVPMCSYGYCSVILWLVDGATTIAANNKEEVQNSHAPSYLFITAGVIAMFSGTVQTAHSLHKPDTEAGTTLQLGPPGPPGKDGKHGKDGKDGKDGEPGKPGEVCICRVDDRKPATGSHPIPEKETPPVPGKSDEKSTGGGPVGKDKRRRDWTTSVEDIHA